MRYVTSFERVGRRKGIKEGVREGIRKAKIEVAIRRINSGITIENIVNITGLTEEEVRSLMLGENLSEHSSSSASPVTHNHTYCAFHFNCLTLSFFCLDNWVHFNSYLN
ncbi:MAG: hypothetical protein ACM3SY_17090 [Candidatus Omnitrophota bacterium]